MLTDNVCCAKCGAEGGVFATIPGLGPVVYCTSCRKELAPEGWRFWTPEREERLK